jgi:CRISPR system Cascade subunit CasD
MSTLLLRLAAPLQSWGTDSKFDRRGTGRAPSKSGVAGLCAAALGIRRGDDASLLKIAVLKFGVRTDRQGKLLKDFHMAHEEVFWNPSDRSKVNREKSGKSYLSVRYYLSDAAFLAGVEGDEAFLRQLDAAIRAPFFPLFLGRRSCPPEGAVSLGVVPYSLREALEKHPPVTGAPHNTPRAEDEYRSIVIDTDTGHNFIRDVPVSFSPLHRKYDSRRASEYSVPAAAAPPAEHDALAELEARP